MVEEVVVEREPVVRVREVLLRLRVALGDVAPAAASIVAGPGQNVFAGRERRKQLREQSIFAELTQFHC